MTINGAKTIEIERKYEVPENLELLTDFSKADFSVVNDETFTLEASYFDTEDLLFAKNRVALRKRLGGTDEGWHIKIKTSEKATEYTWALSNEVPVEAIKTLANIVNKTEFELLKIAELKTLRRQLTLANGRNEKCFLVDDRVQSIDHLTRISRSWREWELELDHGSEDVFDKIEPLLFAAGATVSESFSKIGRARGEK